MMMMSRTQPLGEGRPGLCVAKGGLRVVGGGDAAGKGGSGARARAGHPGGAGCFLSRPRARGGGGGWRKAGPAPPPGIDDSAAGHGHLGQGQRRGRRSADATDGFGGACRRRAPVFRAVSEAKRDRPELRCSRSPCRPPFRILQRRRGPPRRRLFTSFSTAMKWTCHTTCSSAGPETKVFSEALARVLCKLLPASVGPRLTGGQRDRAFPYDVHAAVTVARPVPQPLTREALGSK
nr:uncharacterized protein LOC106847054 isoform X4 [Equus asinus]